MCHFKTIHTLVLRHTITRTIFEPSRYHIYVLLRWSSSTVVSAASFKKRTSQC